MNTTRVIRGFIVTLAVAMIAAANAACSTSGCAAGPFCGFGGGGGGGGMATPTPVTSSTTIAANDTEPVNAGGTQWDFTLVTTARTGPPGGTYNQIRVFVTFAQQNAFNSLPAPGSTPSGGAALGVLIYFDTDSNMATGTTPNFCSSAYQGMEYAVSDGSMGGRLANGNYDVVNLSTFAKTGEATVFGSGNTISYTIPLSAIGGGSVSGLMGVAASNFMGGENNVDCAPDGATVPT